VAKIMNGGPAAALDQDADPVEISGRLLGMALDAAGDDSLRMPGAEELRDVDPRAIAGDGARIAFWANVYNTLLLAVQRERPFRGNVLFALRAFGSYAYDVGGAPFSMNLIEHGILRCNRRPPSSLFRQLRGGDDRLDAAPTELDPRIHFVLNCGARSCPPIRIMGDNPSGTLELAARAYMQAETEVDPQRGNVDLPGLLKLYASDFGDRQAQLQFAARHVPQVDALLEDVPKPSVSYAPFDWRVRRAERAPAA
jgi:hypothetical protein